MGRLFFASLLFVMLAFTGSTVAFAQHKPANYTLLTVAILKHINDYRAGKGLSPIKMDETISDIATRHSRNMAAQNIPFGHDGFDKRITYLRKQIPSSGWAENVAMGPDNSKEIVEMWLNSEGHRKNIEGDYNITGIGVAADRRGNYYYTQIFMKQDGPAHKINRNETRKRGID